MAPGRITRAVQTKGVAVARSMSWPELNASLDAGKEIMTFRNQFVSIDTLH